MAQPHDIQHVKLTAMKKRLNVIQILPALEVGGVERGTVQISRALVNRGHNAIVLSGGGRLVEELNSLGVEHIRLPIGAKKLSSIFLIYKLVGIFLEKKIDIVHSRSRLPSWLVWAALKLLPKEKRPFWVTTVHGPYSVNAYSRIMIKGDQVIAVSHFIKCYINNNYPEVDQKSITVIPRGIEKNLYHKDFRPSSAWKEAWEQQFKVDSSAKILTIAGRLTRWKGQLDFIQLIAGLRKKGMNVFGLIVGSAHIRNKAYENELKASAAKCGVTEHINFLGSRADLMEIFSISDCAYSLAYKPEAFGRTTIEALSLGTPVIGYDHGGTSEVLNKVFPRGKVPLNDINAAINRTIDILESHPPIAKKHPYTVEKMEAATLRLYENSQKQADLF